MIDEEVDILEQIENEINESLGKKLVIRNDDHNSFEHVIACIVKICKFGAPQAEQIAHIIHTKGKAVAKEGEEEELLNMRRAFSEQGIDAIVE